MRREILSATTLPYPLRLLCSLDLFDFVKYVDTPPPRPNLKIEPRSHPFTINAFILLPDRLPMQRVMPKKRCPVIANGKIHRTVYIDSISIKLKQSE